MQKKNFFFLFYFTKPKWKQCKQNLIYNLWDSGYHVHQESPSLEMVKVLEAKVVQMHSVIIKYVCI